VIVLVASSTETTLKNLIGAVAFVLLLIQTETLSTVKVFGKSDSSLNSMFVWRTGDAEVGSELPVLIELPSLLIALVVIYAVLVTVSPLILKTKSKF
jgi:hypothetical protein